MEEFDYTVEISDQDWDSLFQDCEECRLLSPSLAGLEESGMSGMSDMDDMGSFRPTKNDTKVHHVPPAVGLLQEAECSIDYGPPDCEGSPVEHCLYKYGVGGMENVLSGSEEDLHLQSVNTFFEGLRFLTEAERLIEPSQMGVGKNPEPVQGEEEEMWRDGPQASMGAVPKSNILKLNSAAAGNGETTTSKETADLVNTKSNESVMKKDEYDFRCVCFAASNSQIAVRESTNPERELFIREAVPERELFIREAGRSITTASTGVRKQTPSHESSDDALRSEKSPDCGELLSSDMNILKWVNDVRHGEVLSDETALNKNLSVESPAPLEVMSKCKLGRDVTLPSPDADPKYLNSGVSQACSPSPSTKKKRRKKKRVSFDFETGHKYTRQFIANESDSDYESCIWGRAEDPHLSGNNSVAHLNKPEKNVETSITVLPTHWQAFQRAATHNLPLPPMENKVHGLLSSSAPLRDCQYQNLSEMFDLSNTLGNIISTDRIATPQGQTGDDVNPPTNVQSCSVLHFKGSTELNKEHWLPVSNSICVSSKLELDTETAACAKCEGEATHGVSLKQSNEMNRSNTARETSVTQNSVSQSQGSSNSSFKSEQSHKESTCESDLPVAEVANSGEDGTGQSEAQPRQHLAMNCHDEAQCSFTTEKTNAPVSTVVMIGSDTQHLSAQETMHELLTNRLLDATHCSENPPEVSGANFTSNINDMSPPERISCCLDENNKTQLTNYSPAVKPPNEQNHSSEITVPSIPHEMNGQNEGYLQSGELNHSSTIKNQSQNNSISSTSDNLLTSRSNIIPSGSVDLSLVLNKEPIMELLDDSVTSMSNITGSSVCPNNVSGHGEIVPQTTEGSNEMSDLQDTSKQKCHSESMAEDALTTLETDNVIENAPDSKHSVFAMSSFWNEMEKLTIKDILGLRAASSALPDSSLPLLAENVDSDNSDGTDSGYFGSKPDQTSCDTSSISNDIKSNSDPVMASSNSVAVMWVREPDPVSLEESIYPENMMTRPVSDLPEPLFSSSSIVQKYPKKMPKTISVHNLPALESEPCAWRGQTLSSVISENVSAQRYGTSLANIFGYFFGQKQSKPIPSDYSLPPCYIGDSVPETYDHFFSEFDIGSLFSPLAVATSESKDEVVPIFSTNRNMQFPEAYDYFFPSSSSDEDEDDNEFRQPIKVVTRLSQKANEAPISSDIYDNFFTDGDQHNLLFWKNTFSLRNICFTSSVSQNQRANSLDVVPIKQTSGSVRRAIHPIGGMPGGHEAPFPDPLLYHQDRILRQLAEQPCFKYDDLQTAVANPRLDTPFLPLRQSDMCLVCIAFASWVLKSANPQVGDAWKAVLLANISALSAIRYLRKYVRKEASGEKTSSHNSD